MRGNFMRIHVNRAACEGHAMCNVTAPDVFQLDELGYNALDGEMEVSEDLSEQARRGAAACPERAITVIEG
jgi:ferredoxin